MSDKQLSWKYAEEFVTESPAIRTARAHSLELGVEPVSPAVGAQLARLVRSLRAMADGAKDRMREEMGPEFDEVDWKKLDPRQYDPRRIIRDALLDDAPVPTVKAAAIGAAAVATASAPPATAFEPDAIVPYDTEAT